MSLNAYVKECLYLSLIELMEQKPFQNISITELTQKAGFSRMTFYRNYHAKEDILLEYLQQITSKIVSSFHFNQEPNVFEFLELFFLTFRNEKRLIENLINSRLTHLLNIHFQNNAENLINQYKKYGLDKKNIIEPYKIHYIAGGLIEVLINWSQKSMKESDIEMAQKISRYLHI